MATGQEITQAVQCAVYKTQEGNRLVVDSSGELDVLSGGKIDLEAGSQLNFPVQSLGTGDVATTVTNFGLSVLTGSTTGPTYTMAAPIPGIPKFISLSASSSGVTHRAILRSNSTGVSFDTTGGNQITFATSATRGVTLVAASTSAWKIAGVYTGASIAAARTT